jgi:hypothetical protein
VRALSETASTLTVHYPMWLGLACLAVSYGLSYWFIKTARKSKKPIQQFAAGIGGIAIGSVVGFGALFEGTTLDATGARETRLLASQSAAWANVAEARLEERRVGKRGLQPHLVLRLAPHGEMAVEISGLDPGEIERVIAFARERAAKR